MDTPKTLLEAVRYFSDITVCEDYMRDIRWSGGAPVCPACKGERIGEIATRRLLRCKDCRKQFSHKVGTIFEHSPLGLDKWFVAVWAIANCKNGISSHELARTLGVEQRSAWFMLHRIRKTLTDPSQVRAMVLGREDGDVLTGEICRNVKRGATIYTDEARVYRELSESHAHAAIDHSVAYAIREVHKGFV